MFRFYLLFLRNSDDSRNCYEFPNIFSIYSRYFRDFFVSQPSSIFPHFPSPRTLKTSEKLQVLPRFLSKFENSRESTFQIFYKLRNFRIQETLWKLQLHVVDMVKIWLPCFKSTLLSYTIEYFIRNIVLTKMSMKLSK